MSTLVTGAAGFIGSNFVFEWLAKSDEPVIGLAKLTLRDRPGHDCRQAIEASKLERELGWRPSETFETGIFKTVYWYLQSGDWVRSITISS